MEAGGRGREGEIEATLAWLVRRVAPWARVELADHSVRPSGVSWDGEVLTTTGATHESRLHEIAHMLVAPPERRREPEWGLGPDPYRRSFVEATVPREEADREELDACALQLLLARLLDLDETLVMSEYGTAPLDEARIRELFERHPDALPPEWWSRALG